MDLNWSGPASSVRTAEGYDFFYLPLPIGSMHAIYIYVYVSTYIYHKNQPNVGVHTIHLGYLKFSSQTGELCSSGCLSKSSILHLYSYTYEKKYAGTFRLLCKKHICIYKIIQSYINE